MVFCPQVRSKYLKSAIARDLCYCFMYTWYCFSERVGEVVILERCVGGARVGVSLFDENRERTQCNAFVKFLRPVP